MSIEHIVATLIQERDRLNRAIEVLRDEKKPKVPGKTSAHSGPVSYGSSNKRGWTAAQKKAQREKMKAYWAKRRAGNKKGN